MISKKDIGYKEIVMNLSDGIVIELTVASLKKIIKDELESSQ